MLEWLFLLAQAASVVDQASSIMLLDDDIDNPSAPTLDPPLLTAEPESSDAGHMYVIASSLSHWIV
jgi:hypothetical protein